MKAGDLSTRACIESLIPGDGWGTVDAWWPLVMIWCNVRHLSGAEAIKGDRPVSEVRASIRTRYRPGITAGMRVVIGDDTYDIHAVLPDRKAGKLDLACELVK